MFKERIKAYEAKLRDHINDSEDALVKKDIL